MPRLHTKERDPDADRAREPEAQTARWIVPPQGRPLADAQAAFRRHREDLGVEEHAGLAGSREEVARERTAVELEAALRVGDASHDEQLREQRVELAHRFARARLTAFESRSGKGPRHEGDIRVGDVREQELKLFDGRREIRIHEANKIASARENAGANGGTLPAIAWKFDYAQCRP